MKEGEVVLPSLPQADGHRKIRPALVLSRMPGFGDFLVCGLSTQLNQEVSGFDETLVPADPDFEAAGLVYPSLVRLGYLHVLPESQFHGSIGYVSEARHKRLSTRLANHLLVSV